MLFSLLTLVSWSVSWSMSVLVFIGSFLVWTFLFTKAKPLHISREEADTNFSGEREIRTVTVLHATWCTCVLFLYLQHVIPVFLLSWIRLMSVSFLAFDLWMTNYIRMDLMEKEASGIMKSSPWKLALHHVGTTILLYGYPFQKNIEGFILYCWAEVPMIFVNLAWYLIHTRQGETPFCHAIRVAEIATYGFCRVFFMPLYFGINLLPGFNCSFLGWILLATYVYIYVETCKWYATIVRLNWNPLLKAVRDTLKLIPIEKQVSQ